MMIDRCDQCGRRLCFQLEVRRPIQRVLLETGEGAIKSQLLAPSITAHEPRLIGVPVRKGHGSSRAAGGLITDRAGPEF